MRGSYPTAHARFLEFGGNTACIDVQSGRHRLIIDAGTGIIGAVDARLREPFDLLLTHFHWDHIQGLPFFSPLYDPHTRVTFFTGQPPEIARDAIERPMTGLHSPALEFLASDRHYVEMTQDAFVRGDITVHPFPLHHPQGAVGVRLECDGAVVVHASDLEHGDPKLDRVLRDHAQGADVLVYDAQYTDAEYASKRGWGHSTWREATRVARDAGVKKLVLFHHDPSHDDGVMEAIVAEARQHFENTDAAREGTTITP